MRRLLTILLSFLVFTTAAAQNKSWAPANGRADLYPTARSAAESMADAFAAKLRASDFKESRGRVIVTASPDEHSTTSGSAAMGGSTSGNIEVTSSPEITQVARTGAIQIIITRLQHDLPGNKIVRSDKTTLTGENDATIEVAMDDVESVQRSGVISVNGYQGRLRATLSRGDSQESFEAGFVNMPWVSEWSSFIRAQPSSAWIVGRSDSGCASEDDAYVSACNDAAAQFVRMAQGRVRMGNSPVPYDALQQIIANQLRMNGATERFVQRADSEKSSSWRGAVLVASNDQSLRMILPSIASVQSPSSPSTVRLTSIASIFLMVLVIVALYLFLQGATRGVFTSRLRIGAAAFLLIAAALLLLGSLFFVGVRYEPSAMPARAEIHKP